MTEQKEYDVMVIGAGSAGYAAAIRAAQLGLKTACVDTWKSPTGPSPVGSNYVTVGCISSIALLETAKLFYFLNHGISDIGVNVSNVSLNLPGLIKHKNAILKSLSDQIVQVFSDLNIDFIHGKGQLVNANTVEIIDRDKDYKQLTNAKQIILATGSSPIDPPFAAIDDECIIDTTAALELEEVPKKLAIIGASVIGVELGSIWKRLGSDVILLEAQNSFLPIADHEIAQEAYAIFTKFGLDIRLGARVIASKKGQKKVSLEYEDQSGQHRLRLDKVLIATGRKPNTENLAYPEANLLLDENGYINVDDNCGTNLPGVYAIGDLVSSGPMLAHKGLEEGFYVADHIAGKPATINYNTIPSVIYTEPEIAWVGQTEQALKAIGENYKVGYSKFRTIGRAHTMTSQNDGMVKVLAQADTDKILGVHILGSNASENIAEAVLAMEFSASTEDIGRTIHAHPTLAEAIREAALDADNRSLHSSLLKPT